MSAVDYIAAGLALVAIPAGKKGPTAPGWNRPENAITSAKEAAALTQNIGLAHAYCTPTPTMALDVDDIELATRWLQERGVDLAALLEASDAVQIVSGRAGRDKLLYRLPAGVPALRTVQVKAPGSGDMVLEFRCAAANGLTVQDVLPPSIHPTTGKPYAWGGAGDWRRIPEIPGALLDVWTAHLKADQPSSAAHATSAEASVEVGPETIRDLRSALLSMRADDRALWVKAGMALKPLGDVGRGLWLDWSLTSKKSQVDDGPLGLARTWDTFNPTGIDYRFVFAEAQRRGWDNPAKTILKIETTAENEGGWKIPEPLPRELRTVKTLDVECLPSAIRGAVVDIAERLTCPLDYVVIPLLVGAGALVGNRIGILPKEHDPTWEVYPAFWGGIIGPPGSMKTPAQNEALKPLRHIEEQESIGYAAALARYQVDKKQFDKDIAAFKAGKAQAIPVEPVEPRKPRLVVNDTTYQALGEILAANPRGVLVHGDELSGLLQSLDAPGQEAARGFYLSGWGGSGSYTFDRIGRGSIRLSNYCLSVLGGFQPDKVKAYVRQAQSGSAQNDGLLQRFQLIVWPDLDRDFALVDRAPDQAALMTMNAALLGLRDRLNGVTTNKLGARLVHFDAKAQTLFNQWFKLNEQAIRRGELGASEQSHFAKFRSLIPGLALLFHLLEGHDGAVCEQCLVSAIGFAGYLKSHARRVYGAVHGSDGCVHALTRKLRDGDLETGFTLRSVYIKCWSDLTDKDRVRSALDQLAELGWLRESVLETGGRKTTSYEINPRIAGVLAA